jgi:hypothetical protein
VRGTEIQVQNAVDEWLAHGLDGRSRKTISTNREVLTPLTALIGAARLRELTAVDVRSALAQLATSRSTSLSRWRITA